MIVMMMMRVFVCYDRRGSRLMKDRLWWWWWWWWSGADARAHAHNPNHITWQLHLMDYRELGRISPTNEWISDLHLILHIIPPHLIVWLDTCKFSADRADDRGVITVSHYCHPGVFCWLKCRVCCLMVWMKCSDLSCVQCVIGSSDLKCFDTASSCRKTLTV